MTYHWHQCHTTLSVRLQHYVPFDVLCTLTFFKTFYHVRFCMGHVVSRNRCTFHVMCTFTIFYSSTRIAFARDTLCRETDVLFRWGVQCASHNETILLIFYETRCVDKQMYFFDGVFSAHLTMKLFC